MKNANPAKAGITQFRASQIGTANAVDLIVVNKDVTPGMNIGTISGGSGSHTLICPVNGRTADRNDKLLDQPGQPGDPSLVSTAPFDTGSTGGWLVSITLDDPSELNNLLTAEQYDAQFH
jgi:glycine cleavage system H protein